MVATLESGWLSTGPRVAAFEQAFAEYTGARHAVAVNSCTAALHLSLLAAGIGDGRRSDHDAADILRNGELDHAHRRDAGFADIDPITFNLDPSAASTPR